MSSSTVNDSAKVEIQERGVNAIEDRSLPAGQVLSRPEKPTERSERPGLFIP